MMNRLNPYDIVVALRLCSGPATYQSMASELGSSPSQVFDAVNRLKHAQLLRPGSLLAVNKSALREFIVHGLRYAFPAQPGERSIGVPTAHSGPALASEIDAAEAYIWPAPHGDTGGQAVEPLYPGAPRLRERAPHVYNLLTLVDALRVGAARERNLAREKLDQALAPTAHVV